jgi:AcrR family transcriptional regulator
MTRRNLYKAETRRALLTAAENLFVAEGFAATTVGAITEAAFVSKGTFYNHFIDKTAIFADLYSEQLSRLASIIEKTCATFDACPETSAAPVMADFINHSLALSARDMEYRELVAAAPAVLRDGCYEINKRTVLPQLTQLFLLLRLRKNLSPTIQIGAAAQFLLAALFESNRILNHSTNREQEVDSCALMLRSMLSGLSRSNE